MSMPLFACGKTPEGTGMSGEAAACAAPAQKIAAAKRAWRARMRDPRWHAKNAKGGGYVPPHRCIAQARGAWSHLGGVRADDRLIDGGAPTGAGRQQKLPVLDHVGLGEQLGFPALVAHRYRHERIELRLVLEVKRTCGSRGAAY